MSPILVQMASEIALAAPSGAPMVPLVDLYRFFMVSVALGQAPEVSQRQGGSTSGALVILHLAPEIVIFLCVYCIFSFGGACGP